MSTIGKEAAFPRIEGFAVKDSTTGRVYPGLTKREIFALGALVGLLTDAVISKTPDDMRHYSSRAVMAADALIEALNG